MRIGNEEIADDHWVRGAQAGDATSFEVLFDRYYDMIHAFAFRICLVETEADDLAQETFIRAARGIASYRGAASFKNWLYRIAHHAVIDWQRQQARNRMKESAFADELNLQSATRPSDHAIVHAALRQLPPEQRETVALVYFEGLSHREAAEALGCAETTISWRIFRAKRALKDFLVSGKGGAT